MENDDRNGARFSVKKYVEKKNIREKISLTFRPIRSCVHAVIERRLLPWFQQVIVYFLGLSCLPRLHSQNWRLVVPSKRLVDARDESEKKIKIKIQIKMRSRQDPGPSAAGASAPAAERQNGVVKGGGVCPAPKLLHAGPPVLQKKGESFKE